MYNFKYSHQFAVYFDYNNLISLIILMTLIHLQNNTLFKKNDWHAVPHANDKSMLKKKKNSAPLNTSEQVFLLVFLHKLNITWWTNPVRTWNTGYGGNTLQLLVTHANFNLSGSPETCEVPLRNLTSRSRVTGCQFCGALQSLASSPENNSSLLEYHTIQSNDTSAAECRVSSVYMETIL